MPTPDQVLARKKIKRKRKAAKKPSIPKGAEDFLPLKRKRVVKRKSAPKSTSTPAAAKKVARSLDAANKPTKAEREEKPKKVARKGGNLEQRTARRLAVPIVDLTPKQRSQVRRGIIPKGVPQKGLFRDGRESEGEFVKRQPTASLETITPTEAAGFALTPPAFKGLKVASMVGGKVPKLAAKALGKTKPAKKVAKKPAVKKLTKRKVPRSVRAGAVAGAVAAEPHSRKFVKRHAEATKESPGKVTGTTLRAAPGILIAPGAALASAGITAGRLATGHKKPLDPVKATGKSLADFTKDTAAIAGDDDAKAKKLIKEQYGLTGLAIPAPFAVKAAGPRTKPYKREHEAKTPIGRKAARRRARKDVSVAASIERTRADIESDRKVRSIIHPAQRAKTGKHKVRPEDALGLVMEEGLRGPSGAAKAREKHAARPRPHVTVNGQKLDPGHVDRLFGYLADPATWRDPNFKRAVHEARKLGSQQRWSERARLAEFQKTHGLRTTDEIADQLMRKPKDERPASPRDARRQAARIAEQEAREVRLREGLAEPEAFGHVDILPRATTGMSTRVPPTMGKKRYKRRLKEGSLAESGRVAYTGGALAQKTIREPARAAAASRLNLRVVERGAIPVETSRGRRTVITQAQAREALFGEKPQVDPDRVVFVPSSFKSAVKQMDEGRLSEDLANIKAQMEGGWAALDKVRGKKGTLMEREVFTEYMKQISGLDNPLGRLATQGSRNISRAILYNPAWAMSQVPATALTAATVSPRLVKGLRATKKAQKASPETGDILAAQAGRVPGAAGFESAAGRFPMKERVGTLERLTAPRTRKGRAALTLLDSPSRFNKWSEGNIRQAAFAANVDKQVNGVFARMSRLRREQRALWEKMRGKPLDEQLRIIAKDEKALASIRSDTLPLIGDFAALTRYEKIAAPMAIFYPFMRMSVKFLTYGLPMKHPVKHAVAQHLAQWNADELKKFLGGDPSFFAEWATLLIRTGEGDKGVKGVLPVTRIAPGGSYIPEAIGEAAQEGALPVIRAFNPLVGGVVSAISGVDPLSGNQVGKGGSVSSFALAASNVLGAPAPARLVTTLADLDRKNILTKREKTAVVKLFAKMRPKQERLIRGFATPAFPTPPENARDLRSASRALDLIRSDDSEEKKRGQRSLNRLLAKHGIPQDFGKTKRQKKLVRRYGLETARDLERMKQSVKPENFLSGAELREYERMKQTLEELR